MSADQRTTESFSPEEDHVYYRDSLHKEAPTLFKSGGLSELELLYTTKTSSGIYTYSIVGCNSASN